MTRQSKFGLWVLAAVVIAAGSYFVGSLLKPGEEEPYFVFDTEAPAFVAPVALAATSQGGFTGFGETDGGDSRVVVSGRVIATSAESLTLESAHGLRTEVSFADSPRIFRMEPGAPDVLRAGVTVALRLNSTRDMVESVLVLSEP